MAFATVRAGAPVAGGFRAAAAIALLLPLATPAAPAASQLELRLSAPVEHIDTTAREPMLVQHPAGTLFLGGYQRENPVVEQAPALWRSDDDGRSWRRVDVGRVQDGAMGNSDIDIAVAADGTLYLLTMGFDRSQSTGTHVVVGVSEDLGETWTWTYLTRERAVDRPWIAIDPEGVAHVVWNDGAGVGYRRSSDRGVSWSAPRKIADRGGSSHLAVGPAGELAARVTPLSASGAQYDPDAEWILVSDDGGDTWEAHDPPGRREFTGLGSGEEVPRWVEPLAWDGAGNLYYLWSEGSEMWLGRSPDAGLSWLGSRVDEGAERRFFPYLAAGPDGALAASWFTGSGADLAIQVVVIRDPDTPEPAVIRAPPFQAPAWTPTDPPVRDPAGEYVPVTWLSDGRVGIATPLQDPAGERFGFTFRTARIER